MAQTRGVLVGWTGDNGPMGVGVLQCADGSRICLPRDARCHPVRGEDGTFQAIGGSAQPKRRGEPYPRPPDLGVAITADLSRRNPTTASAWAIGAKFAPTKSPTRVVAPKPPTYQQSRTRGLVKVPILHSSQY